MDFAFWLGRKVAPRTGEPASWREKEHLGWTEETKRAEAKALKCLHDLAFLFEEMSELDGMTNDALNYLCAIEPEIQSLIAEAFMIRHPEASPT